MDLTVPRSRARRARPDDGSSSGAGWIKTKPRGFSRMPRCWSFPRAGRNPSAASSSKPAPSGSRSPRWTPAALATSSSRRSRASSRLRPSGSRRTCAGCGRTRFCVGGSARRRGGKRVRRGSGGGASRTALPGARAPMKVALVTRAVLPLHGYGGLERHVYDLARALAERDVDVTLITQPPLAGQEWTPASIHPAVAVEFVPYRTFPGAGKRGTTVLDRSTAYPLFGLRAGRRALDLVKQGKADIVHGLGASVFGYARARLRGRAIGSAG